MSPSEPFGYFREIVYFSLVHKLCECEFHVTETGILMGGRNWGTGVSPPINLNKVK